MCRKYDRLKKKDVFDTIINDLIFYSFQTHHINSLILWQLDVFVFNWPNNLAFWIGYKVHWAAQQNEFC